MPNKKILVVDDSDSFQETMRSLLSMANFDVITASDGKEGFEKISKDSPDLVILDCNMPEMDGYQVVKAMRADPLLANKPVIMLTGRDTEYDEILGLSLGIDDYIIKPFNPSLLVARVNSALQRKIQSIGANPLTYLSGNTVIKAEAEKRIEEKRAFSMIYIDLSNFKSFNDKYGFEKGDEVLRHTANIIIRAVREFGEKGDFLGHIGGDDFIVLTGAEIYPKIAEKIIEEFDSTIGTYYDRQDAAKGYIESVDRNNRPQKFPIMTISIAIISTSYTKITHYGKLSQIAAELKKVAKKFNNSSYVVDRRKQ